jgi:chromosome segregation ATPase
MSPDEIQKVLSQTNYLLGQLPELIRELNGLSETLPAFVKSKSEELAVITDQINAAGKELEMLNGKIADAKQKHAQLEASQKSLNDWMSGVKSDLEGALSLPQAQG